MFNIFCVQMYRIKTVTISKMLCTADFFSRQKNLVLAIYKLHEDRQLLMFSRELDPVVLLHNYCVYSKHVAFCHIIQEVIFRRISNCKATGENYCCSARFVNKDQQL